MIPQKRVNEAAETANDYTTANNHNAFNDGFECGVRFAEAELKPKIGADTIQNLFNYFQQEHGIMLMPSDLHEIENYMQPELATVAQEFAEWCDASLYEYHETYKVWCKYPDNFTTSELFAKFDAERSGK